MPLDFLGPRLRAPSRAPWRPFSAEAQEPCQKLLYASLWPDQRDRNTFCINPRTVCATA
jgi:hypothetical protein